MNNSAIQIIMIWLHTEPFKNQRELIHLLSGLFLRRTVVVTGVMMPDTVVKVIFTVSLLRLVGDRAENEIVQTIKNQSNN